MRRYKISEAIGGIGERHIEEAADFTVQGDIRAKRASFVKWLSLAACICLLITGAYAAYDAGLFDLGISDDSSGSSDGSDNESQGGDPGDKIVYGTALTLKEAVNAVHFNELFTFEGYQSLEITYMRSTDACEISYRYLMPANVTVRAIEYHSGDRTLETFDDLDGHLYRLSERAETADGYEYDLYSSIENDSDLKSQIAVIQYGCGEYDLFFCVKFDLFGENEERDVKVLIEQMKLTRFGD